MSGKGKGASRRATRQQQQQDAARRRAARQPGGRDRQRTAVTEIPKTTETPEIREAPRSAPPTVYHYADVAAVRIQDWLGRTPGLMFRRGASALLSKATDPDEWKGRLPAKVRWNDEAGHVDGVVSLVAEESVTDADASAVLQDAAREVARRMRALMPHCPLQAVAGYGPSYAQAYADMAKARREGDFLLDWPPAPPEAILAKQCGQCRQAAATVANVRVPADDTFDLCAECAARASHEAAGRTSAASARLEPAPERRLKEALGGIGMPVKGFSDNFASMAESGRRGRDDPRSQLAVIFADGNRVGAFLSHAAAAKDGPKKSEIAPAIEKAAIGALAAAVRACFPGNPEPPVLPHLAGGDDILVSVPAPDAWLFAMTLLGEFERQIRAKTSTWHKAVRENSPTLSAGLVFHHQTYSFSDVLRLAEEQLKAAKKATAGRGASLAFLDVTADGGQPPEGREALTLTYLEENADRFRRTAALPASRRATLLDMARRDAWKDFAARLADLPNEPLWEFATGTAPATGADARKALSGNGERRDGDDKRRDGDDEDSKRRDERRGEVRRALDVARHWEGK